MYSSNCGGASQPNQPASQASQPNQPANQPNKPNEPNLINQPASRSNQINQAKQAQKRLILERFPELESLPASQFASALAQRRQHVLQEKAFLDLQKQQTNAEAAMLETFPELFITNEEIQAQQREQRVKLKGSPEFQKTLQDVAKLVKTEMEYRHQKNAELKELWKQVFKPEDK